MVDLNPTVIRTLNYLRGVHLPTYVALRLMLDRVRSSEMDRFIESVITQATIRKVPRVLSLKRFKSAVDGRYVYRNYSVPSPTSALADTHAISVLHAHKVVDRRDFVYSYRRPDEGGARNFEHFSIGYRERNEAIGRALSDPALVAVILDIRNFYPSVDAAKSLDVLRQRLGAACAISDRDQSVVMGSARRACLLQTGSQGSGLRVGPEMSHILADISLEKVDSILSKKFGSHYFRYVDDIVVVVPRTEAAATRKFVGSVVEEAGHSVSEEKDCVADAKDWLGYLAVSRRLQSSSATALNKFKFRAKLFLAKRPPDAEALRVALRDVGVFLPVDQLLDASRQRVWRYRVSSLFSRNWRVVAEHWSDSLSDVVAAGGECRRQVIEEVDRVLEGDGGVADSMVARKWHIQDARMAINRALYFADDRMLMKVHRYTSVVPELAETSAVCLALLGDSSQVMKMPGPAVAAFSQVAGVRGAAFPNLADLVGMVDNDILADISAHFALRGGGDDVPLLALDSDSQGLTVLAHGSSDIRRLAKAGGYGSEVASLAVRSSLQDRVKAASTRFSLNEDVVLDALSLSANYVS